MIAARSSAPATNMILTPRTMWQTQFAGTIVTQINRQAASADRGTLPSFNVASNLLHQTGLSAIEISTLFGGGIFSTRVKHQLNRLQSKPGGNATLGGKPIQTVVCTYLNTGFHGRAEMALAEPWTLVAGIGGE